MIKGKVYSTTGNILEYATIRLLQKDSSFIQGTITDTLGYYQFKNIDKGEYLLSFSCMGYKSQIQPINTYTNKDTLFTQLESNNILLDEVVVKGASFIRQKDKVLILPDKEQVKHAGTGYDLLYNLMIPELTVNRRTGEVSTLGGTVTLYINGEKADQRDVQSLRPRDIEKVEYYDVPVGKYANDVAAINYITKTYHSGGYVAVDGKQAIGYLSGDYNVSAKFSRKQTTYSLWAGHSMKKYGGEYVQKQEEILFPDYTVGREHLTEDANADNNQQYMQFKVNHTVPTHNLSAQFSLVRNDIPENSLHERLTYSGHYNQETHSSELENSKNLQPSLYLYGNFNLPKQQTMEFSLRGTYSQNDYTRTYAEDQQQALSEVGEDMYTFDVSGRYDIRLPHDNTFGVYGYHLHRITSSTYGGDAAYWQHLWSGETLLFLNYTQRLGSKTYLSLSPGFSYLNYKLHDHEAQRQYSLRLKTNLVARLNEHHQLVFALNIGNNTPEISRINEAEQVIDFLQVKRGNPYLKNANIYSGNIVYSGQFNRLNLQAIAVYERSHHASFTDYYLDGDKLVSSYSSDANVNVFMSQLNVAYRFSDHLRSKLSGGYMYFLIPELNDLTNNCFFGSFDLNYYWKNFSVNAYANASTSRLDNNLVFTKEPFNYGLSLGWSHKEWMAEIGTENPFTKRNHYRSHADYGIYHFSQVQTSRLYQRTGYVKVAYTFDFGRKTSREQGNVNRTIHSAIMKAN